MDCHAKFTYALFARNDDLTRFISLNQCKKKSLFSLSSHTLSKMWRLSRNNGVEQNAQFKAKSLFCWFSKALIKGVYGFSLFVLLFRAAF